MEKLSEHDKYVLTNRMLVNELYGSMPQEDAGQIELEPDYGIIDKFNRIGWGGDIVNNGIGYIVQIIYTVKIINVIVHLWLIK